MCNSELVEEKEIILQKYMSPVHILQPPNIIMMAYVQIHMLCINFTPISKIFYDCKKPPPPPHTHTHTISLLYKWFDMVLL